VDGFNFKAERLTAGKEKRVSPPFFLVEYEFSIVSLGMCFSLGYRSYLAARSLAQ
jgi:hypothetical protein